MNYPSGSCPNLCPKRQLKTNDLSQVSEVIRNSPTKSGKEFIGEVVTSKQVKLGKRGRIISTGDIPIIAVTYGE